MCHFAGCAGCGDDWGDDWGGDEVGVADFFFFLFLLDVEREERASGEAVFACDFDCLLLLFVVSADVLPVHYRLLGGVSVGDDEEQLARSRCRFLDTGLDCSRSSTSIDDGREVSRPNNSSSFCCRLFLANGRNRESELGLTGAGLVGRFVRGKGKRLGGF